MTASNGGFIPWQLGPATRIGRFQVVLGRELAVTFDGVIGGADRLIVPDSGEAKLVDSVRRGGRAYRQSDGGGSLGAAVSRPRDGVVRRASVLI